MYLNSENRVEIRNLWSMTKKKVIRNLGGWTSRNFSGKGKIVKNLRKSENFSEIGGNLKQGEMHHGLRGMDAPGRWTGVESLTLCELLSIRWKLVYINIFYALQTWYIALAVNGMHAGVCWYISTCGFTRTRRHLNCMPLQAYMYMIQCDHIVHVPSVYQTNHAGKQKNWSIDKYNGYKTVTWWEKLLGLVLDFRGCFHWLRGTYGLIHLI